MEKRTSSAARITAALALIAALIVLVVVASAAMNGNDDHKGGQRSSQHQTQKEKKPRSKAKTYTVETGDTLTAISHKTGVPVAEILALNPEVDPQILIAGQTLKLK